MVEHVVAAERRDVKARAPERAEMLGVACRRRNVERVLAPAARVRHFHVSDDEIGRLQDLPRAIEEAVRLRLAEDQITDEQDFEAIRAHVLSVHGFPNEWSLRIDACPRSCRAYDEILTRSRRILIAADTYD